MVQQKAISRDLVTRVLSNPVPAALAQVWIKTFLESMKMSYVVPKYCPHNQTDTKNRNNHMVFSVLKKSMLQLDT